MTMSGCGYYTPGWGALATGDRAVIDMIVSGGFKLADSSPGGLTQTDRPDATRPPTTTARNELATFRLRWRGNAHQSRDFGYRLSKLYGRCS